jgi:hypothetical protein
MAPRMVYVVFHETNTGRGDESDGYIETAFTTEPAAQAAADAFMRRAAADGIPTWTNPDDPEAEGNEYWEAEYIVIPLQVHDSIEEAVAIDEGLTPAAYVSRGTDEPGKLVSIQQPPHWFGEDIRTTRGIARWWPEDGRRVVAVLMNPGEVLAWTTTITDHAPEHVFAVAWSSAQNEVRP